jgi:hypothetical protein
MERTIAKSTRFTSVAALALAPALAAADENSDSSLDPRKIYDYVVMAKSRQAHATSNGKSDWPA